MPGDKTKFRENWLDEKDNNGADIRSWCRKGRNPSEAYCLLCLSNFSVANSGRHSVLQRSSMKKHSAKWKAIKGQRTLLLNSCNSSELSENGSTKNQHAIFLPWYTIQQLQRAEALWALKVATSNYSFASCSNVCPIFAKMFEGHPVAEQLQMSEKKVAYTINYGLYPYFHELLIDEVKRSLKTSMYTVAFAEMTSQVKKQMDIYVRFWSAISDNVQCAYLHSIFLGHAPADVVKNKLVEALENSGLPLLKFLMLSMDGPTTNLAVERKLNLHLKEQGSPAMLLDIGTCNLHKVHNAFHKGVNELELDIDEFASDLFGFFKLSSARREDLSNLRLMECEEHYLLRHVNSRWLTMYPVVERILEQYEVLHQYFLEVLPNSKDASVLKNNQRYHRIRKTLQDGTTVSYLEFIKHLSHQMTPFLSLFQTEGPLIHLLYEKRNGLLRTIMMKFIKEDAVCNLEGQKLIDIDVNDMKNLLPLKDIQVGVGTKRGLSKLNDSQSKLVRLNFRQCLIKICNYMKSVLPVTNCILKDVQIIHPLMKENPKTDLAIMRLCVKFKALGLTDDEIDRISQEWKIYRQDVNIERDWFVEEKGC